MVKPILSTKEGLEMIGRNFRDIGLICAVGLTGLVALILVLPTSSIAQGGQTIVE